MGTLDSVPGTFSLGSRSQQQAFSSRPHQRGSCSVFWDLGLHFCLEAKGFFSLTRQRRTVRLCEGERLDCSLPLRCLSGGTCRRWKH